MSRPAVVPVGTIGRAHGVRGWVRVRSDMEPAEELLRYGVWLLDRGGGEWRPAAVEAARPHGKAFVARLEGVDDRDAAAGLAGTRLGLPRGDLPEPEEGRYYWADLIGLEVVNEAGEPLGVVREMIETGANDVMVIGPAEVRAGTEAVTGTGAGAGAEARIGSGASAGRGGPGERIVPFLMDRVVRDVDLEAGRIRVAWDSGEDGS